MTEDIDTYHSLREGLRKIKTLRFLTAVPIETAKNAKILIHILLALFKNISDLHINSSTIQQALPEDEVGVHNYTLRAVSLRRSLEYPLFYMKYLINAP
jgi:hypothetical protein